MKINLKKLLYKNIDIDREDSIQLKNLRRNQNKKFHEIINGLELLWFKEQHLLFFWTITGLNQLYDTPVAAWGAAPAILEKINEALKTLSTTSFITVVEKYLRGDAKKLKEEVLALQRKSKAPKLNVEEETLRKKLVNYPHFHGLLIINVQQELLNQQLTKSKTVLKEKYFTLIHNLFIQLNYDFDLQPVVKRVNSYRNVLKYILKDQRGAFKDTYYTLFENFTIHVYDSFDIFQDYHEMFLNINGYNFKYLVNENIIESKQYSNSLHGFIQFIKNEMNENNILIFKNNLYKKNILALLTYELVSNNIEYLGNLIIQQNITWKINFLGKFWKLFMDFYKRFSFLDSNLYSFNYIELHDYVWHIKTNTFIEKTSFLNICFKYIKLSKNELITAAIENYQKLILNKKNWFRLYQMMLITGKAIVEGAGIKGFHVYIHGKSDTGKSTIIETFYKWLYGPHNIGILGTGTFKLEHLLDKQIIIINEYKFNKKDRELMLKVSDASLISIEKKHKTNVQHQITQPIYLMSNYSVEEQGMDKALINRFIDINLTTTFKEIGIIYNDLIAEFPYILYRCLWIYFNLNKNVREINEADIIEFKNQIKNKTYDE